ncbi:MAG TPA: hypothetical protein VKW04_23795 [Planctomycetota bacterium]|nr:hypothetical protein [Planctomycetota bacterium]
MSGTARGALALLTALVLPACNLTYGGPDQGFPQGGGGGAPFVLTLPVNGELQAPTNPEFAWITLDGATNYRLQVSTAPDFSQIVWDDSSLTVTSTFLTQVTLTNFTTYYWQITGFLPGGGTVLAGGSPSQFRTQGSGMTTPVSFSTQVPSGGATGLPLSPSFAWQGSDGADSYSIEIDPAGTFSPAPIVQANIHVNRGTLTTPLSPNTTYFWRVLAVGQLGNRYSTLPTEPFTTGP